MNSYLYDDGADDDIVKITPILFPAWIGEVDK